MNTAGEDEADSPCVEYNAVVCHPEFYEDAMQAVWATIRRRLYDEVVFSVAVPDSAKQFVKASGEPWPPRRGLTITPASYVDLDALRNSGRKYVDVLSPKARYQVRQSSKACNPFGDLWLKEAETQEEAGEILDELADLHGKAWSAKDNPGAFASARFRQFHNTLIV